MRRGILNAYNLHKKTLLSKKCEKTTIITKYLIKTTRLPKSVRMLSRLKLWSKKRADAISHQTAVCRRLGGFKRVINITGFGRHALRQHLNVKAVPVLKKMSW